MCFVPHILNAFGIWPSLIQYLYSFSNLSYIRELSKIPGYFPEPNRLMEYYWLPIAIISTKFYFKLLRSNNFKFNKRLSTILLYLLLIAIILPSEMIIWTYQPPPTYLRIQNSDISAMNWIKINTSNDAVIISHPESERSGFYRAQWILEIHTERKVSLVPEVFSDLNVETIQRYYKGYYIYLNQWALSEIPNCKQKFDSASNIFVLVFSAPTTYVYRIN